MWDVWGFLWYPNINGQLSTGQEDQDTYSGINFDMTIMRDGQNEQGKYCSPSSLLRMSVDSGQDILDTNESQILRLEIDSKT